MYEYRQWDGDELASRLIGFDTETELVQPGRTPRLAVAQAFDGEICFLIHPDDLGRFISRTPRPTSSVTTLPGSTSWSCYQHLRRTDRKAAESGWPWLTQAGSATR